MGIKRIDRTNRENTYQEDDDLVMWLSGYDYKIQGASLWHNEGEEQE